MVDCDAARHVDIGEPDVAVSAGDRADIVTRVASHFGEQPPPRLIVEVHCHLEIAKFVGIHAVLERIPAGTGDGDVVLVFQVFARIEI
ncbi:MAG: hypothetical protein FAZ92_02734 [Accumulibacter sp.]|nr:MAG: hypothetical protein FAZ92_02734 [Accumulibacter sp.]